MSLQALLADVHPRWHDADGDAMDAALLRQACGSRLGRRLLAGGLAEGPARTLLAPSPGAGATTLMSRWSRPRMDALHRDLGVLAYAPAIRAEVNRATVKHLKHLLANAYLLALDRTVWDARVDPALQSALGLTLAPLLAGDDASRIALFAALELQGRAELQAWALQREPALAEWARLMHAPGTLPSAHLPEKPVLVVLTHHQNRAVAA
jgi:hypothetical protein